jgi:hypothetical protein
MKYFGWGLAAVLTLAWLYGAYRVFRDGIKARTVPRV